MDSKKSCFLHGSKVEKALPVPRPAQSLTASCRGRLSEFSSGKQPDRQSHIVHVQAGAVEHKLFDRLASLYKVDKSFMKKLHRKAKGPSDATVFSIHAHNRLRFKHVEKAVASKNEQNLGRML
jgi:hypothetical protein